MAAEKEKRKEAEDAENTHQIAEDALNRDFTGRMAAYKKCDLRALAVALSLSDKGTNAELQSRIQNRFEESPDLKRNSRFSGLFKKSKKGPTSNEDTDADITASREGQGEGSLNQGLRSVTHLPNTMASSSSNVNYNFNQYPMSPFAGEHPQPNSTNHITSNFRAIQPHSTHNYYHNFTI